ncbi:hypothetical protein [Macrococcus armenti]|uniref:hypothetical protein n=1 Tax=Macrococcus armenti TaxID=2875764 RepID=UPI001CC9A816|nr:hypothetical protein [Macrococcus armenti]UBH07909.1 hypothetical protein LAU41_07700 [Macrococcus armenti]UBH10144.1 hypothetical protein LAU38_07625 [Macrococcus armenti]
MKITTERVQKVIPLLNETEHLYLSLLAANGNTINKDSIQTEYILPNLVEAGLVEASNGKIFEIETELINLYNTIYLKGEYELIKAPTEDEIAYESDMLKQNLDQYETQLEIETKINKMIETWSNQKLVSHLQTLCDEDIIGIIRFYQLEDQGDKLSNINVINDAFFKDFTMIQKMQKFMDFELQLNIENALQFNYDNFTYMKGATREIFAFSHEFNEILFIPKDVLEHFKKLKASGIMNPEIEKIKFYRGMMNLYGFVRLDFMQKVYKKVYRKEITVDTIKQDISTYFPNLVPNVKGNWVKHEIYSHQQMDLDVMFSNMEYYMPINAQQIYKYVQNSYVENMKLKEEVKVELKRNMKGEKIYSQQVEALFNEIVETFRVTDSFETAFEFVADLGARQMVSIVPTERLTQLLKTLYTEVRLWRIGGYKVIEMPEYKHQKKSRVVSYKKRKKK